MSDTNTTIASAFASLIAALKTEAVSGDFERTTGFLRKAQDMEARWSSNRPAHGPRASKEA